MIRFALYASLTKFLQDGQPRHWRRSARQPSSRLWLLPWHVPPIDSMSHRDEATDVAKSNVPAQSYPAEKRTISVGRRKRSAAVSLAKHRLLPSVLEAKISPAESARRIEMLNRIGSGER
jgi:hypothetical protein